MSRQFLGGLWDYLYPGAPAHAKYVYGIPRGRVEGARTRPVASMYTADVHLAHLLLCGILRASYFAQSVRGTCTCDPDRGGGLKRPRCEVAGHVGDITRTLLLSLLLLLPVLLLLQHAGA
jgi:hypothetical protein